MKLWSLWSWNGFDLRDEYGDDDNDGHGDGDDDGDNNSDDAADGVDDHADGNGNGVDGGDDNDDKILMLLLYKISISLRSNPFHLRREGHDTRAHHLCIMTTTTSIGVIISITNIPHEYHHHPASSSSSLSLSPWSSPSWCDDGDDEGYEGDRNCHDPVYDGREDDHDGDDDDGDNSADDNGVHDGCSW